MSSTDTIPDVHTEPLQFYPHRAHAEPQAMETSSHVPNAGDSSGRCMFEGAERAVLSQRSHTPAYRTIPYRSAAHTSLPGSPPADGLCGGSAAQGRRR